MSENQYPNWFSMGAIYYFNQHLGCFKGKPDLKFLQLGAYTGDASFWLVRNILTGKNCKLVDVDTWQGSDENVHKTFDWNDVKSVYDSKTAFTDIIIAKQMTTTEYLQDCTDAFDFIYIDADHTEKMVYQDADLSWPLLKPGGIMAFDDYTWGDGLIPSELTPKPAIDRFLIDKQGEFELLEKTTQVWIKKI
jgi:predicted O-methyltransferase YrrM